MAAAENDALAGAKVGGIGDVVRDVPPALVARADVSGVDVLTPSYGALADRPGSERVDTLEVDFAGRRLAVGLYRVPAREPYATDGVRHFVVDHAAFAACGAGRVYCDDPPERPFATDAGKFALFSRCVAELLLHDTFGVVDALHLHDWHAALTLALLKGDPRYQRLHGLRVAYTIHNLALQGVRPFANEPSSLRAWFPQLRPARAFADPRWPDCVNPMAVGIRLADAVHAVSPGYAREILLPSDVSGRGYYGGEGLEIDLAEADADGRLYGILNGCVYPDDAPGAAADAAGTDWTALLAAMRAQVLSWAGADATLAPATFVAHSRLAALGNARPSLLMTSVGRLTVQKVALLFEPLADGRVALEHLLDTLPDGALLALLGSGDPYYERALSAVAGRDPRLLFLRGYAEALSQQLYAAGDLFLMPSSFEPCGISQMLALRAGQPCLVHAVGGLRDTVEDRVTGFCFSGATPRTQAEALVAAAARAVAVYTQHPARWRTLRANAAAARFRWDDSVARYVDELYRGRAA